MNKIITHLDLDLASSNEYKVINAQQLDNNTRRLEVNLFHEGKIYDITNVTKIELQGFRGDGETIKTPLTNDGNNIIIDFDNTILGAKGICKLKIALFGEDNKLLSSFPFVIRIDQNVYDETGVIASPVYLELEKELKNIEDLKNEIETKLDDNYFVLKKDKDVAGGVPSLDSNTKVPIAELYEATTTRKGITQLTDSVTSASTTTAATPNSVKSVKDSLNSEISRAKSAESTLTTNLNNEITRAKSAENDLDSKKVDKTTVATSTTLGLVKSGTDITVDTSGNVSVNDNSHKHNVSNISDLTATASELNVLDGITATTQELNYVDGVTSNIQTQLNSKSTNGHTHDDRYYTESEVDTTVSNINNSISSHTGNTSNPHSVTKAQVGLGNVENKSSATIRGEITKSNVTTALGYTPYTPNEVDNKFSALETNIDWKESVSTFDDIATTYPNPIDGWTVNVKDTDYTYRYNGTSWVAISANAIPKATNNVDGLLSKEDHTNYEDANSKKHTHSNKSVIDGISSTNVSDWNSAKTHADSTHARTDATKVEKSSTNGNIKINGTETTVYTHPSGTNPHGTTKSDVGLGNVGNFKAVSTVANQGLTDTEKSNARANIGAGTSSFSGSYNDLSNKPTIPTNNNQLTNGAGYITSSGTAKTISDTLPISKGGTGKTNGADAANVLINSLSTGTDTPSDTDYYVSQFAKGGTTTTTYHRRPMSSLWNYIKSKLATVATSGSYNDLSNKPTIPSVGNGTITIKQAGASKGTFTMNQSDNTTIELTDNNDTYGVATSSALGLVKSGTDITVDSSGNVSVNDDSHNHVISNVDGLQNALDGKLDKFTSGGIASCDGVGKYDYFKIATIKITDSYINRPIVFEISGRGRFLSLVTIMFSNESSTDPTLSFFTSNCDNCFWIKKTTTSTWEVYGQYSERYGFCVLHRITGAGANIGVTVNMTNIDSLPSECTQVVYGGNVNYANLSTSATKATQDESGNNIKASYASSIDISDHTITLKNKNGASLGTVTVPDNNTWRPLGTTADTACAGNDSRLSNARPASDVYSWAKASSKPSYSWSEIGSKPSYADQLALSGNTLGSKNSLGSPDGYIDELSFYKGNFYSGSFQGGVSTIYINVSNELTVDKNGTIKLGDHYVYAEEKGTWTPTNVPGSSGIDTSVYEFKNSEYRKIGDIVILTTTATPTNYETKSAELMILGNSFPFSHRHIVSAFAINADGDSSIGIYSAYGGAFKFGTYSFTGASSGITDVELTIIYSL